MEDIKKIQEFFSKSLEENTFKKGDKVIYLGNPAEITFVGKDQMGRVYYSVSYDKGNGKTKASNLYNKGGEIKAVKEDMNDPVLVKLRKRQMQDDAEKAKQAELNQRFGKSWSDRFNSEVDLKNELADLKDEREQMVIDMEQEAEPEGGEIADDYGSRLNDIDARIAAIKSDLDDLRMYESVVTESKGAMNYFSDLKYNYQKAFRYLDVKEREEYKRLAKDFFSKLQVDDKVRAVGLNEDNVQMPTQDQVDKFFSLTQNETHYLNSKPVMGQEGTFNLMPIEPWDEYDYSNWMALVKKAKQRGKSIDENKILKQAKLSSAEYQKAKKLKDFNKDDYKWNPGESLYVKLNESIAQTLAETIKLGEGVIEEELCPKGKAYIKRRKAAGEKSSAYLSGRAVKVCKGQMSGRKKKKKK